MKIIFYKAKYGNYVDKIIAASSFSKYSHCELMFPSGECMSSSYRDGGVRKKYINVGDHWDVFELVGGFDEKAIRYWFDTHESDTYDYLGAIGSAFHIDLTSENKKFCSYTCSICLGLEPIITPGGLFRLLKREKMIYV